MTDTHISDLAAAYGLTTADKISGPARVAKGPAEPAIDFDAWSHEKKSLFKDSRIAGVYMAGNLEGPEMRFWGDNTGAWPVLVNVSRAWDVPQVRQMDRFSPVRVRGLIVRLWVSTWVDGKALLRGFEGYLRDRVEQLRSDWLDMGPELDRNMLATELVDVARRIGVKLIGDDAAASAWLDQCLEAKEQARRDALAMAAAGIGVVVPLKGRAR